MSFVPLTGILAQGLEEILITGGVHYGRPVLDPLLLLRTETIAMAAEAGLDDRSTGMVGTWRRELGVA